MHPVPSVISHALQAPLCESQKLRLILMCSPASQLASYALHQANVSHLVQTPLSEALKFVVVLWGEPSQKDADALNCPALSFSALVEKGKQNLTSFEAQRATIAPTDLATLVYTSGTTGNPKVTYLAYTAPVVLILVCACMV